MVVLIGLSLAISTTAQDQRVKTLIDRVSETSLQTNLQKIAGPGTEGRMPATKGDELAIQYIAAWFTTHHLTNPFSSSTPFLQLVQLLKMDYESSTFSIGNKPVGLGKDWMYFTVDVPASLTNAEVVFIGYGLSVPAYDDLKDVDIAGKLVLFQPGVPTDSTGKPWIANSMRSFKAFFPYRDFRSPDFPANTGALISKDLASTILGGRVDSIYALIDRSGKPHSFNTHTQVTLSIVEKDDHRQSSNIVGIINGTDTTLGTIVVTS
jgi:hypothetical protein